MSSRGTRRSPESPNRRSYLSHRRYLANGYVWFSSRLTAGRSQLNRTERRRQEVSRREEHCTHHLEVSFVLQNHSDSSKQDFSLKYLGSLALTFPDKDRFLLQRRLIVWELWCAGFRHSAGRHARVILDGAT